MSEYSFCLNLADTCVSLCLRHPDARNYFGAYVQDMAHAKDPSRIPEAEWKNWLERGGEDTAYAEYTCSTATVSDALLKENRCIIHAGAFRYRDQAWLIAGPPGVGKSTQMRNLRQIEPIDFGVICGDRPVLRLMEDNTVFVYPSPWNGKENWKGAEGASLGGLIFLERGEENSFFKLKAREAIADTLTALIYTAETEDNVRDAARFTDCLLQRVPMYKLISHVVPDSTELLYNTLFQEVQS